VLEVLMNKEVFQAIREIGGHPYIVGGFVRDQIMGMESKDVDVEVYGLQAGQLMEVLEKFGKVNSVGSSFGVIKLRMGDEDFDFSLPRRDNKAGRGHKGFQVEFDANMTPIEAAARRDFTMNSVSMDPLTGEIVDPFDGRADIARKRLRHTSAAFAEDALRVLRGMQFAARFKMTVASETAELCASIKKDYKELAVERIWEEWLKWATKAVEPSLGLHFLVTTEWIELYPELNSLRGVKQEPEWHPEGDVWVHTLHCIDAAAQIATRENLSKEDRAVLMFATLCHDFGKPRTTTFGDRIRSYGHEEAGVEPTEKFLTSIGCPRELQYRITPLVANHLAHCQLSTQRAVRRLALRLAPSTIQDLALLVEADCSGRPPLPAGRPKEVDNMLDLAKSMNLDASKPEPLVLGRHLMAVGAKPGKELGVALKKLFELQLDGSFDTVEAGVELFQKGI
jgi:tRNA nucleotidyltransferase (CCA-adding enzyme)